MRNAREALPVRLFTALLRSDQRAYYGLIVHPRAGDALAQEYSGNA
jgi:hypothetical protein